MRYLLVCIVLGGAPSVAAADDAWLAEGAVCTLQQPLKMTARAGKARKSKRVPKDSEVKVLALDADAVRVRVRGADLYVPRSQLLERCLPLPPLLLPVAAPRAARAERPAEDDGAAAAPPVQAPETGTQTPTAPPLAAKEVAAAPAAASLTSGAAMLADLAPAATGGVEAGGEREVSVAIADGATVGLSRALRVALYDLESEGVDASIVQVVNESLLAELRKLEGVSAIGMVEIRDMLSHEASKQMAGCEEESSCLAEIAGALGVDDLVTGSVAQAADSNLLVVRRIDQKKGLVTGAVNRRLQQEGGQELLAAIGPVVAELFPDHELRAGQTRGVPEEMALRLDPPPLPTPVFWSGVAATGAALVAGAVMAGLTAGAQADHDAYADLGQTQLIDGQELTRRRVGMETYATTTNALFVGAAVSAAATALVALFTDWHGYREALVQ